MPPWQLEEATNSTSACTLYHGGLWFENTRSSSLIEMLLSILLLGCYNLSRVAVWIAHEHCHWERWWLWSTSHSLWLWQELLRSHLQPWKQCCPPNSCQEDLDALFDKMDPLPSSVMLFGNLTWNTPELFVASHLAMLEGHQRVVCLKSALHWTL